MTFFLKQAVNSCYRYVNHAKEDLTILINPANSGIRWIENPGSYEASIAEYLPGFFEYLFQVSVCFNRKLRTGSRKR